MYCDCPTLGRCCFCMPLRRGVIGFGYLNLVFCLIMVGVYSYTIHVAGNQFVIYHGSLAASLPAELCIFLYCVEVVFSVVLIYGAHKRLIPYIRAFYYFGITTVVAAIMIQVMEMAAPDSSNMIFEMVVISFSGICVQLYLITLVRSLLRRLEIEANPSAYDNPLNQIVTGEPRGATNGVYNNTTAPAQA